MPNLEVQAPLDEDQLEGTLSDFTRFVLQGLSVSLIGKIFGLSSRWVGNRLQETEPDGMRNGSPIYKLAKIVPLIAAEKIASGTDDTFNDPQSMRPGARKEFWQAVQAELKAREQAGELWHTDKVVDALVAVFKIIRTSIVLFSDQVDREVKLTEAQRGLINDMADDLLDTLRHEISEKLNLDTTGNALTDDGAGGAVAIDSTIKPVKQLESDVEADPDWL